VNNKLVLKRSRLVNDFFVNEGVSQERIKVYNYGMENAKESIASKDRRVVIKYWKSEFEKSSK
jgi:outer membrane protein OmpA-like peptidoglycan-associated protein